MITKFPHKIGECLFSTVHKTSQNWFPFLTDENQEMLESSAINNGQSMFATLLYVVEGLETEPVKHDFMQ